MQRPRRAEILRALAVVLAVGGLSGVSGVDEEDADARVERVVNGLLPDAPFGPGFGEPANLTERMRHYETPGVSIAVIDGGRLAWARGFGVRAAGAAEEYALPVDTQTLFQAGSISKTLFALLVLGLVDDGLLDLDEDVNAYLQSWHVPANAGWQPRVTLRQLLSHSAGLTVHGFPGYLRGEPTPSATDVLDGRPPANTEPVRANALPGTLSRYSGGGTLVAQQVVVDVTGRAFAELIQARLLGPLGMQRSTFAQPLPDAWGANAASGHPEKGRPVEGGWYVYPEQAAAGLWSTPSDLARALIEVQTAAERAARAHAEEGPGAAAPDEAPAVVSATAVEAMFTSPLQDDVGLGVFMSGEGEDLRISHRGATRGFAASFVAYPQRGVGAVVMLNASRGGPLRAEIERAIAREYAWPDASADGSRYGEPVAIALPEAALRPFAGVYVTDNGLRLEVRVEGTQLLLRAGSQPPLRLKARTETGFYSEVLDLELSFPPTETPATQTLSLRQAGRKLRAERETAPTDPQARP